MRISKFSNEPLLFMMDIWMKHLNAIVKGGTGALGPITKYKSKYTFFTDIRRNPFSYALVLPAMLYSFVFGYMTLPYIIIAFQRFNYKLGILHSPWVGLKNLEFFFKSPRFMMVTSNTLKLNILFILAGVLVSVLFAILLNELRVKWYLKVTQSTLLFPHFLSWVVVSYIIYALFSTDYGIANQIAKWMGLDPVNWYSKPGAWTWILVLLRIWKETGMQVVIYLAVITGIDSELYEATMIDGANRWQQTWAITVPVLMTTVCIMTLLAFGKIFYGDFGMIYAIIKDNGVLYPTTDVIDTYVFRALRKTGDPSQAMAVGLYQAFMGFVLVFGSNRLANRYFKEGALF